MQIIKVTFLTVLTDLFTTGVGSVAFFYWGVIMSKESKGNRIGRLMADSLINFLHMMYNKNTALRVLNSMIDILELGKKEFK